ncbi:hypothetical protein YC2023_011112 [Brassica napus]
MQVFQIWKTSGLEDFQTTSRKSSRRLPGSLPDDFQEVFQTTSRKSSDGMVLIFHLDIYGSDFGRPMGSLLRSLLKYNALEDFQEVFQMISKKSSRRLPGSFLTGSSSISSGV